MGGFLLPRYWVLTLVSLLVACSAKRDPVVTKRPDGGETGGRGAEGGEPSSTGGSNANGGNAGTGGSGNTAGLGSLDPDEVYLLGSIERERAELLALCHWSSPDEYAVGFDPSTYAAKATVGQSALIYQLNTNWGEAYYFNPDRISTEAITSGSYPQDPIGNDPRITTFECPAGSQAFDYVVGPEDRIVYLCTGNGWWENGVQIYEEAGDMLSLGYEDSAFFTGSGLIDFFVVDLGTDERYQVDDIGTVRAVRATRDGFLVAGIGSDGDGLWEVSFTGESTAVGLYEPQPFGTDTHDWALDAEGDLFEIELFVGRIGTVTRRTVGGSNEVVYDDELEPENVFTSGGVLVTGP